MGIIGQKKTLMFGLMYITIMSLVVTINKTKAAGHSVTIYSPMEGALITNAYKTALTGVERTTIAFDFEIDNYDHFYTLYTAWIDGSYDKYLSSGSFSQYDSYFRTTFYYNAQAFLDHYGQGEHTFTLWLYHSFTVTIGLAEGPNPDDDIVWVEGTSYRITEYSVTFNFDPPVLHFVAFCYIDPTGALILEILYGLLETYFSLLVLTIFVVTTT